MAVHECSASSDSFLWSAGPCTGVTDWLKIKGWFHDAESE